MILKNKKGITLIELIISIALISIVIVFLFRLLADVRYTDNNSLFNRKNQQNRALIIKTVQQDFLDYQLVGAKIEKEKIEFHFKEGGKSTLNLSSSSGKQTVSYTNHNGDVETWIVKPEASSFTFKCPSYVFTKDSSFDFFAIRLVIPMKINDENKSTLDDLEFYYIGEAKDLDPADESFSYNSSYDPTTCG